MTKETFELRFSDRKYRLGWSTAKQAWVITRGRIPVDVHPSFLSALISIKLYFEDYPAESEEDIEIEEAVKDLLFN